MTLRGMEENTIDIHHLRYFVAVANLLSFTLAAESLHVTQPTISKMIQDLEREYEVKLFDRGGKKIELTDAGRALWHEANRVLEALQGIEHALQDIRELEFGTLRVGIPPMTGTTYFSEILAAYHKQYPHIELQITEVGAKAVERAVMEGTLDAGIVVEPLFSVELDSLAVFTENLSLVLPATHPMLERVEIRLTDLKDESWVMFREDFILHDRILEACQHAGFLPKMVCKSSQWDFIAKMVESHLGIAILPTSVKQMLKGHDLRFVPIQDFHLKWNLGLVWRQQSYLPFSLRKLLKLTRQMVDGSVNKR